ncbi:hypothetical protein K438DRAFT_2020036 [Mycena galopus ATCC 62051]|nr:hypothetical protein K438DRAFT_2020036 [Mycena galopus ATCC 62051]
MRTLFLIYSSSHTKPSRSTLIALYFVLQVVVLITLVTGSDVQFLLLGSVPPVIFGHHVHSDYYPARVSSRSLGWNGQGLAGRTLPAGTASSLTMLHQSPGTEDALKNDSPVSENGEKFSLNAPKNNDELV